MGEAMVNFRDEDDLTMKASVAIRASGLVIGGTYRHFRTRHLYRVESWSLDERTKGILVQYRRLIAAREAGGGPPLAFVHWSRPLADFFADVEHGGRIVKRFALWDGD